jgi:hypothetical protein
MDTTLIGSVHGILRSAGPPPARAADLMLIHMPPSQTKDSARPGQADRFVPSYAIITRRFFSRANH